VFDIEHCTRQKVSQSSEGELERN